jgi:hypothetical protein
MSKEIAVQYSLLIYGNEAAMLAASEQQTHEMHAEYMAYTEAMQKAGIRIGGQRLRPTARTRRRSGSKAIRRCAGFFRVGAPLLRG